MDKENYSPEGFESEEEFEMFLEEEELFEEPVVEEPVVEEPVVEEPVVKKSKPKKETRLIVTSVRAHVFAEADLFSTFLTGVVRGNILFVLEDVDEKWFKIEIRRATGNVVGFIEKNRVKVM